MSTSTHADTVNHQVLLAARPTGMPTHANWNVTQTPVVQPGPGGVLVKTLAISLDPAMRGWMNEGKSYIRPVAIGALARMIGTDLFELLLRFDRQI